MHQRHQDPLAGYSATYSASTSPFVRHPAPCTFCIRTLIHIVNTLSGEDVCAIAVRVNTDEKIMNGLLQKDHWVHTEWTSSKKCALELDKQSVLSHSGVPFTPSTLQPQLSLFQLLFLCQSSGPSKLVYIRSQLRCFSPLPASGLAGARL